MIRRITIREIKVGEMSVENFILNDHKADEESYLVIE